MVVYVGGVKFDLLVNCVGMFYLSGKGEISLCEVDLESLKFMLVMNVLGFLMMVKYFGLNFMKRDKVSKNEIGGFFVNILVRVGLIIDNVFGGWYSYRMFKVVFNMVIKNLSIEFGRKCVICVCLYLGIVNIDLFRCYYRNVDFVKIFIFEYLVNCLMKVIEGLEVKDNGKFFVWDGIEIFW